MEQRFYIVNGDSLIEELIDGDEAIPIEKMTDDQFMTIAERQGTVYTKDGFVEAFNNDEISSFSNYLRIINV